MQMTNGTSNLNKYVERRKSLLSSALLGWWVSGRSWVLVEYSFVCILSESIPVSPSVHNARLNSMDECRDQRVERCSGVNQWWVEWRVLADTLCTLYKLHGWDFVSILWQYHAARRISDDRSRLRTRVYQWGFLLVFLVLVPAGGWIDQAVGDRRIDRYKSFTGQIDTRLETIMRISEDVRWRTLLSMKSPRRQCRKYLDQWISSDGSFRTEWENHRRRDRRKSSKEIN